MSPDQIGVTLGAVVIIAAIVWFFWLKREDGVQATVTSSGYQEATVLVKGGYTPATIRVIRGTPVRLTFRREETAACSDQVILDAFGKHADLPEGQLVPVEFLPKEQGRFPFTCSMGMFRGTIVVQ